MTNAQSISVFVPVYNEKDNVRVVAEEISHYLKNRFSDYELLLVISEKSTDGTNDIARDLEREIPHLRVVNRGSDVSYAGALRTGFKSATKELIFFTDGDRQFDINELDLLMDAIKRYDVVTGYKIKRSDPLMRIWMSWLYNVTMRTVFRLSIRDINGAFKLYRRKVVDAVQFLPDLTQGVVNVEMYLTAREYGYTIGEVGVHHFHRLTGSPDSEIGARGKIIAFVRPRVILESLKDTYKLWKKIHGRRKAQSTVFK